MTRSIALFCMAAVGPGAAETHTVVASTYHHTFARDHPVLARIRPGDTVATKTVDSAGYDGQGIRRTKTHGNPLTGPFYIEGAARGDAIAVHLERVRLNRASGYSAYRIGLAALTPEYIETIYPNRYPMDAAIKGYANLVPWEIDLRENLVRLREPKSRRIEFAFPARPMIGCIGVAPAGDFRPTSGPAGPYGGNLDYNEVREGATILLPVYHDGALLFLGDGHALQGDGEAVGSGVETSLDVQFRAELRKKAGLSGPRIENDEFLIAVGSQPEFSSSLDRALAMATSDMARWLVAEYRLEPWAAHLLIGYQARYDVVTVAGSMALKIPKRYLPRPVTR
jgi:acetamidase/formamidase